MFINWMILDIVSESVFSLVKYKTVSASPTSVNPVNIYLAPIMGYTLF